MKTKTVVHCDVCKDSGLYQDRPCPACLRGKPTDPRLGELKR